MENVKTKTIEALKKTHEDWLDVGQTLLARKEALGFLTPEVTLNDFVNLLLHGDEDQGWAAHFLALQNDVRAYMAQRILFCRGNRLKVVRQII